MTKFILFCALIIICLSEASSDCIYGDVPQKVAWANTELAGRLLYNKFLKAPGKSDAVVSLPILLLIVQSALYAEGDKFRELTQWLNICSKDEMNQYLSFLTQEYKNDTGLSMTFGVVGDESDRLSHVFEENFKKIRNGNIEYVNYSKDTEATNRINSWFKDRFYKATENAIDSGYLRNRGRGLVFLTNFNIVTSWDHPYNPKSFVDIDFKRITGEIEKQVALYGNALVKYAEFPSLNARMLMLQSSQGVQNSILYVYPNNPSDMLNILYQVRNPSVFYQALSQLRDLCLKLKVTTGQAHTTNRYSTHIIPDLGLNLTDLRGVKEDDRASTHVYAILQQLHLIADKDIRDGPINTKACPDTELPAVTFDHPFFYYVMNEYKSPIYTGVFMGN